MARDGGFTEFISKLAVGKKFMFGIKGDAVHIRNGLI